MASARLELRAAAVDQQELRSQRTVFERVGQEQEPVSKQGFVPVVLEPGTPVVELVACLGEAG